MMSMWRDDAPLTKNPLRFFLFASRPHWKVALAATLFSVGGAAISSSVSYIFKLIVNASMALQHGGSYTVVLWWCGVYILFLGVSKVLWRIAGFAGSYWATGSAATARYALVAYVTLHSRAYFSDRFAGSIMNKIRHAAAGMRETVDVFLWQFLELGVSAFVSFFLVLSVNATVALIFLVWILVILLVNIYLGGKRVPLAAYSHELESLLNGATVDLLTNVGAMQDYARREFEVDRIRGMTNDRRISHLKSWHFGELTRTINGFLLMVFGGAMTFTAVTLAQAGALSVGDIVLVITVIFNIEGLLQSLGSNFNKFAETWGEIEESLDEIILPHEIPDKPDAKPLVLHDSSIDFDAVTFGYTEQGIFKGLSFSIPSGQRVGLVGRSGAGKSTIVRLLQHHHDLSGGSIKIGGTNIATVTQESLRAAISIVPQEPLLFHRTIRENIGYGRPDASDEEIIAAAKLAQAHEFISRLPQGYESLVGERGIKLSGGERQRIAIARAILKNAPILLLDEATSALDSESEVEIQKALHELMKGKTVIAIAHRLSTLREMDRLIVLDRGAIAQEGTHDELVGRGGIYAELWAHQAGGFLQQ
jgi:ATP-binding cassette subfamily B protein